jgi:metallo-beta-lactamase family protein
MLRLHFHGAAQGVTGSCFLLESDQSRLLVDCGLFQGSKTEKELNYRPFPFRPASVDAMVLTHAHIDHSGLIPRLFKEGFAGPLHSSPATADLCSVMLPDSGHIQEMEVMQLNGRNARRGRAAAVEPIYTAEDAKACLRVFRRHEVGQWFDACAGVRARLWNAGHLLGSCSVELEVTDEGRLTRLLFSGDLGPAQKLLQFDPEAPAGIDYVVCESTYGDTLRDTVDPGRRRALLRDEVIAARHGNGGALLIPAFAVERTQELLLDLVALMEEGDVPDAPIFIDSPLATRASEVFAAHANGIENGKALVSALNSPRVRFTETVEQSKAIGRVSSFHVIMAASGMCEAGRIRHHLKDWLWRKDGTVLLVGFQAQGTLGRILQDGASRVRIQGEDIEVRARIRSLDLYSGHADAGELTAWVKGRLPIRANLFLVHGEEAAIAGLGRRVSAFLRPGQVVVPALDAVFALTPDGAAESEAPRRMAPEQVARLDWHNDLSRLMIDIDEAVRAAADERARRAVIRKIRRALADDGPADLDRS